MPYWLKCFLMGVFVGYMLCMFTGYILLLIDKRKEKENVIRESKKEQSCVQCEKE